MSLVSILLIGFAMSADAFAAAIGKGAAMQHPQLPQALRAGVIFGVIEGLTPVIGWALGVAAASYITRWDHWIAFVLLVLLGGRMIYTGLRQDKEVPRDTASHGFWSLAVTGFATSIDAMAIGVGMAFIDVNIGLVACVIGSCTLVMVTIGIMLGRVLGAVAGRRAEVVGGAILIVVGSSILYGHLAGTANMGFP